MDISMSNNSTEDSHTVDGPSGVSDTTQVELSASTNMSSAPSTAALSLRLDHPQPSQP